MAAASAYTCSFNNVMKKRREAILREAEAESEAIKKEKMVQAKEKFLQLKEEHERDAREKDNGHAARPGEEQAARLAK